MSFWVGDSTVTISTLAEWGKWGTPVKTPGHIPGYQTFEWPVNLDIKDAYHDLDKAGYGGPFSRAIVFHSLNTGVTEPYYNIKTGKGAYVGANSGKLIVD